MAVVRGGCVFRNDGDGCLSSKYVNENSEPFVEACWLPTGSRTQDPFVGTFDTVWLETDGSGAVNHVDGELTIIRGTSSYTLEWMVNNQLIYKGVGMIYHELLVCGYWSV